MHDLNDPTSWLTTENEDRAVTHLVEYMTSYSGRFFERFAARTDPHRFEAGDVVAVSCLGVEVPPEVCAWLLLGEGQNQTAALLAAPELHDREADIRTHELADNVAARALWELLRERPGMGPTKVSKLMAAKRPNLVPIFDLYVSLALLPDPTARKWRWWQPWQELMRSPTASSLVDAVQHVREGAASKGIETDHLSVLRVIDIVVWRATKDLMTSADSGA